MSAPIIQTLLDTDWYQYTCADLAHAKAHAKVPVKYAFRNRTADINLADFINIDELNMELGHVQTLRFTENDLDVIAGFGLDDPGYLNALRGVRLPEVKALPAEKDFEIEPQGEWLDTIWWEIAILPIINELYSRSFELQGRGQTIHEAINGLKGHPDIKIAEFGTRRRYSLQHQRAVIDMLRYFCPENLIGTSNVMLAHEMGLKPIGTYAHECPMIYSGIYRDRLRESHGIMLQDWWDVHGEKLAIGLPDTYGSDFFWDDFTEEQAHKWRGWREDSGNVFERIQQGIDALRAFGVDPMTKTCVPSDGLDIQKILAIHDCFANDVNLVYGWGSSLVGCSTLGLPPVSIVVKAVEANGHGLVKLSNNWSKSIGKPEDVALFKKTFGHTTGFSEKCRF